MTRKILQSLATILLLFGILFAIISIFLHHSLIGLLYLLISVIGGFWLRQLNRQKIRPMPRPGLDDED